MKLLVSTTLLTVCLAITSLGCGADSGAHSTDLDCNFKRTKDLRGEERAFSLLLDKQDALDSSTVLHGKMRITREPVGIRDDDYYFFGVEVMPEGASAWTMISNTEVIADSGARTSNMLATCGRLNLLPSMSLVHLHVHELLEPFGEDLANDVFEPMFADYTSGERIEAERRTDSEEDSPIIGATLTLE